MIQDSISSQIIAIKPDNTRVCAFFNIYKYNGEKAKEIIGIMNSMDLKHAIVVYSNKQMCTPTAKKTKETLADSLTIELFSEDELQYNITKHVLQPKFEVLTDNEAIDFRKKYGAKFPVLLVTDPISRFYGYKRGNVVKITRKSGYVDFRIVKG